MKTINLSSTKLKRDTGEILNLVAFGGVTVVVERHGEPLVKIVPAKSSIRAVDIEEKVKKYFGSIPDFPSVSKRRYFRRRRVKL